MVVKCDEARRERIDLDIAKIASLGEHGRPFPTNRAELEAYCHETRQLLANVERYIAQCYERSVRDIANIVLFNIKSLERKLCRRKGGRKLRTMLAVAPCMNRYAQPNTTCLDRFKGDLIEMYGWPSERNRLKIPFACW